MLIWLTCILLLDLTLSLDDGYQLVLVEVFWRHGDRNPIYSFPGDKNKQEWEKRGFGKLTMKGLEKQVELGQELRDRYIKEKNFLNVKPDLKEIYVRSTDSDRTLLSATANLIGMFFNESNTNADYPNGTWPKGYIPIPIHTVNKDTDHFLNPISYCPRYEWLWTMTKQTKEVKEFLKENQDFLDILSNICGKTVDLDNLWIVYDVFTITKESDLPLYVNETIFNETVRLSGIVDNFEDGLDITPLGALNLPLEIAKVRGGTLINTLVDHFNQKLSCLKNETSNSCRWYKDLKYIANSAHDNTMAALLVTLGAKKAILPIGYPSYTAAVMLELYKTANGSSVVKLIYKDANSFFKDFTSSIAGCENLSMCPLSIIQKRAEQFNPGDIDQLCLDVNSSSPQHCSMFYIIAYFLVSLITNDKMSLNF